MLFAEVIMGSIPELIIEIKQLKRVKYFISIILRLGLILPIQPACSTFDYSPVFLVICPK